MGDQKKIVDKDKKPVLHRKGRMVEAVKVVMADQIDSFVEESIHTEFPGDEEKRVSLEEAKKRSLPPQIVVSEYPMNYEGDIKAEMIEDFIDKSIANKGNSQEEIAPSYKRALEIKEEAVWCSLDKITVVRAIEQWLERIRNPKTRRAYLFVMQELIKKGFIDKEMTLQQFSMRNHNVTVDEIMTRKLFSKVRVKRTKEQIKADKKLGVEGEFELREWSKATREQRAAGFISFTGFLSRRTGGIVRKAIANKEGQKTFSRITEVKTKAFAKRSDWKDFLEALENINKRDCLFAKLALQGGKRISEVLTLRTDQIDYDKNEITFNQAKTKDKDQTTVITYPPEIIKELFSCIGERNGLVFVTSKGKPIAPQQISRNFERAGERAKIGFKVTPHVLRTTAVTQFKIKGESDSSIMKTTGHASSEMIAMYDKSSKADNASKRINLV